MKKKRILSLVLSFALVFTTVFAGAGSVFASSAKVAEPELKTAVLDIEQSGLRTKANVPSEPLNVGTMLYSTTAEPAYNTWTMPANSYVLTTVTPDKSGLLYFEYAVTGGADQYDNAKFFLLQSCELTAEGLSYQYYENYYWYGYPGDVDNYYNALPVEAGTTYQLLIVGNEYNGAPVTVQARAKVYTTNQRDLAQGNSKWTLVSGKSATGESGQATWFKIKPKTTGVMTVNLKEYGYDESYGYVQLYNAKKKAVSEKVWHKQSTNRAKFGVKKNTTYYIKVSDCYGSGEYNYTYGVKYTVAKYTDRAINKKAKAKKLVRKAKATNTLFVASTSTSTDWYKFYVSSKRKTRININAEAIKSGKLTVTFYKGNKKIDNALTVNAGYSRLVDITYGTTYGKANSGWYYVKVVKSKKASGKYTIRYVK